MCDNDWVVVNACIVGVVMSREMSWCFGHAVCLESVGVKGTVAGHRGRPLAARLHHDSAVVRVLSLIAAVPGRMALMPITLLLGLYGHGGLEVMLRVLLRLLLLLMLVLELVNRLGRVRGRKGVVLWDGQHLLLGVVTVWLVLVRGRTSVGELSGFRDSGPTKGKLLRWVAEWVRCRLRWRTGGRIAVTLVTGGRSAGTWCVDRLVRRGRRRVAGPEGGGLRSGRGSGLVLLTSSVHVWVVILLRWRLKVQRPLASVSVGARVSLGRERVEHEMLELSAGVHTSHVRRDDLPEVFAGACLQLERSAASSVAVASAALVAIARQYCSRWRNPGSLRPCAQQPLECNGWPYWE